MRTVLLLGATLLGLAGCAAGDSDSTTLNPRGDRVVPDSAGKCTQMVGAIQYRVKCPDQK